MKLLITGAYKCAEEQLNYIKSLGHNVTLMQNEVDALPCDASEIEGVICNGLFLHHSAKDFTNLRFVQLTSAGLDRVPLDYFNERGIKVYNARGVYSIPMAEFSLMGVLALYKNLKFFIENQQCKQWVKHRGNLELYGKTVLVVGAGNVGTECAKRFKAFGCKVLGVDVFVREDENFEKIYHLSSLNELLSVSDVVILTLPLTNETRNLFNEKRFACMKQGSVLVNVARGGVVDESALLNALDCKLLGAVLDVFEKEPLDKENPLYEKQNVIITPHNSFVGDGNFDRLTNVIINNLKGIV